MPYCPCHIRLSIPSPAHAGNTYNHTHQHPACKHHHTVPALRRFTPFPSPSTATQPNTNHTGLQSSTKPKHKHTPTKQQVTTRMSQPMASSDQIGIPIDLSQQGPEAPIRRAPVAKKARAKTGGASAGGGEMNDFDFKFGFNFQSPAKTIRSPLFWRAVAGELVATALFLYICLTCVMFNLNGLQPAAVTNISLCFGLTITVLVYSFAGISGANLNPAVTLGLAITRKMSLFRAVCYVLAQLLGATIGAAMARHVSPEIFDRYNGGVNFIGPDVTLGGAFLAEFMGTFVLVFTVFCAIDTERGDEVFHMPTLAPLAIGLSVTLMHFGMIGIDNCSINPARSFGASAVAGIWQDHWLFWFGPLTGSVGAAFMYELVFKSRKHWENKYLPYNSA